MGNVGSGQATKIGNQMIVSCNVLVIAEVLALLEKAGVDSTQVPEALKGGFADSIPLQITGSRMARRELDDIKWRVKTLLKDLNMAGELASAVNGITPMSELAKMLMQRYSDHGLADRDPATLIKCYDKK
jgi:3-hydroxyisobutyrate dehydrogenase